MGTVGINGLAGAVLDELEGYSQEVTDGLKQQVRRVTRETAEQLQQTSPRRSGEYAEGWTGKVLYEDRSDIRAQVYNRKKPQLTHLLEDGHAKVNGGRVEGLPHIDPAEEEAARKLEGRVEVMLER